MIYSVYTSEIHSLYKLSIDFFLESRDLDKNLNCALNMNTILAAACYLEGILAKKATCVLGYYQVVYKNIHKLKIDMKFRRPMNLFWNKITSEYSKKISRCAGITDYINMFEFLLEGSMKDDQATQSLFETIQVLFQLRNVVAHDREIQAYTIHRGDTEDIYEEKFFGGYKKAEELLIKRKLLNKKFIEEPNASLLFTNDIVDYF